MKRRIPLVAVLVLSLPLMGCPAALIVGGAAVGAGAIVWHAGWLQEDIPQPIYRVHRAAAAALLDFDWQVGINELEQDSGVVDAFTLDGTRVVVKTEKLEDKMTRVRIRVGLMGDKGRSREILDQIKKHL